MFSKVAQAIGNAMGTARAFFTAVFVILVWGGSGPHFHYSDTWQLVVNTGTTIITFLMVFLERNASKRDMAAIFVMLAELIKVSKEARNDLMRADQMAIEELDTVHGPGSA